MCVREREREGERGREREREGVPVIGDIGKWMGVRPGLPKRKPRQTLPSVWSLHLTVSDGGNGEVCAVCVVCMVCVMCGVWCVFVCVGVCWCVRVGRGGGSGRAITFRLSSPRNTPQGQGATSCANSQTYQDYTFSLW